MSLWPLAWARLRRRPLRSASTIFGVAAVAALASAALMVHAAGHDLKRSTPGEPLIAMQAGRICPSTSHLPLNLSETIANANGVAGVKAQLVVVSDCKISTTATTFRGVDRQHFLDLRGDQIRAETGDIDTWLSRDGQALVGSQVASAQNLKVGDTLESAGITVTVAAVISGPRMQDRASVWVDRALLEARLPALRGTATLFEITPAAGADGEALALAIDDSLAGATTTAPFSQAAARVAGSLADVLQAGGVVALAAALAGILLLINATVLGLRSAARDLAVLRAIGHGPVALAAVVGAEGAISGFIGGSVGGIISALAVAHSATAISTEGIAVIIDPRWTLVAAVILAATALGMIAAAVPGAWALRSSLRNALGST